MTSPQRAEGPTPSKLASRFSRVQDPPASVDFQRRPFVPRPVARKIRSGFSGWMATLRTARSSPVRVPLMGVHDWPESVVRRRPRDVERTITIFGSERVITMPVNRSPSVLRAVTGAGGIASGATPGVIETWETVAW
jgi:hypothetical protein